MIRPADHIRPIEELPEGDRQFLYETYMDWEKSALVEAVLDSFTADELRDILDDLRREE